MAHEDDHISDVGSTFDFKGFILKVISYWKLILLSGIKWDDESSFWLDLNH